MNVSTLSMLYRTYFVATSLSQKFPQKFQRPLTIKTPLCRRGKLSKFAPGISCSYDAAMLPGASSCRFLAMGRPSASPKLARKLTSAPSTTDTLAKRASLKWKNTRASRSAHLHGSIYVIKIRATCKWGS